MNVYKYHFNLGDRVSRPTPWPTSSHLHQLPLAQEAGPWKQGRKAVKPCPQKHPWDQAGLGKGPRRHLDSSKISSLVAHLLRSLPPRWLPYGASATTSQLSAVCCFPSPYSFPADLPLSFAHLPRALTQSPALPQTLRLDSGFRCVSSPCGPVPSASALPLLPHLPLSHVLSLTPSCCLLCLLSWLTLIFSIPIFSPVSSYLPWLFHLILFSDTCPSNSPCFL